MAWLIATAAACVCFSAAAFGTLVPLQNAAGVEYFFAWPGAGFVAGASLIASGAIAVAYSLVLHVASRRAPSRTAEARSGEWLSPLTGLACAGLGVLPALPGIGKYGAPAAYFLYDLRWWWAAALVGWTALRADAFIGGPLAAAIGRARQAPSAARLLLLDLVLVAGALSWATATTPNLRFSYLLHGDEPKYLRYCEVWCQGGGFDISQKALFVDEPLDGAPRLDRTIAGLLRACGMEIRDLATDLRRFAVAPRQFQWNRVAGGNAFIRGRHGGIYQIHQPGLSAVLFPGYVIDRYLLALNGGIYGEFPAELPMTTMLSSWSSRWRRGSRTTGTTGKRSGRCATRARAAGGPTSCSPGSGVERHPYAILSSSLPSLPASRQRPPSCTYTRRESRAETGYGRPCAGGWCRRSASLSSSCPAQHPSQTAPGTTRTTC